MPTLPEPPRHLLAEVGRRAVPHRSSAKELASGDPASKPAHSDLPSFACGLTGTSVEVLDATPCQIEGTVPDWLEGDLLRNGPGTWDIETKSGQIYSLAHWYASTFCRG